MDTPIVSNIRRLLALRSLTIRELGRQSGVHRMTIQLILTGNTQPTDRTVGRLAAALGVTPGEINPSLKEAQ